MRTLKQLGEFDITVLATGLLTACGGVGEPSCPSTPSRVRFYQRSMLCMLAAVFALVLSACGGGDAGAAKQTPIGGESPATPPPVQPASPAKVGGIWKGRDSQGVSWTGLISENGQFHLFADYGILYRGTFRIVGSSVFAETVYGTPTPERTIGLKAFDVNAGASSYGSFAGTATDRQMITGIFTASPTSYSTPPGPPQPNGPLELALFYDSAYELKSSLDVVSGTYRQVSGSNGWNLMPRFNDYAELEGASSTNVLTIGTDGTISAHDENEMEGCNFSGKIQTFDERFGLYWVTIGMIRCERRDARGSVNQWANGPQEMRGFATFLDGGNRRQLALYLGVPFEVSSTAMTYVFNRS